jgi:hypothetical protein
MGIFAQIQNRASERAFATQPDFFMLGDPRIAMQSSMPYTITADTKQGNRRVIRGVWQSAAPTPGVLPLRIPDGAAYQFIRVKGIGAIADDAPFYNRSVQSLNVQEDKVALILHPDGEFEIELRATPPLLWSQADALRDAAEFVWCSIAPVQTLLAVVPVVLLAIIGIIKRIRHKPLRPYLPALGIGLGWACVQLVFCLFRAGKVSITSYLIQPNPTELGLAFVGTTAFVTLGLSRMLDAHKRLGKIVGLGICVAPVVMLIGFYASFTTLLNVSMAQKSPDAIWALNYAPVRMIAIVGLIELVIFLNGYRQIQAQ